MRTAIIGIGNIGSRLARLLVQGGERVVLASRDPSKAAAMANSLGKLASAASVDKAIAGADAVIYAVAFDLIKKMVTDHRDLLKGKLVIDPSNAIEPDGKGGFGSKLLEGQSAGAIIASLLPAGARFVKAFGTLSAASLGSQANRTPERAVLFYATDDDSAVGPMERLIRAAGFEPVRAGGVKDANRIEVFGDLHQFGGLQGKVLNAREARSAVAAGNAKDAASIADE
jgi:predicted dinucleotide-binding enzyme